MDVKKREFQWGLETGSEVGSWGMGFVMVGEALVELATIYSSDGQATLKQMPARHLLLQCLKCQTQCL